MQEELEEDRFVEIAGGEPARETVVVPTIIEDSAAVVPRDAIEHDSEAAVSSDTARSAELTSSTTPWLTPWTWYHSSTRVVSGTTHDCGFGADGVESHSQDQEKTGAMNLERNQEAQDRAGKISSSSLLRPLRKPRRPSILPHSTTHTRRAHCMTHPSAPTL